MNSITKLPTPPVFYWFNTYNKKSAVIKPSKQFSTNILSLEGTRKALTGPDLCGGGLVLWQLHPFIWYHSLSSCQFSIPLSLIANPHFHPYPISVLSSSNLVLRWGAAHPHRPTLGPSWLTISSGMIQDHLPLKHIVLLNSSNPGFHPLNRNFQEGEIEISVLNVPQLISIAYTRRHTHTHNH